MIRLQRLPGALALVTALVTALAAPLAAQPAPAAAAPPTDAASYIVFLGANPIGREDVTVVQLPDGWAVRGTSRQGRPIDVVSDRASIEYDRAWRPTRLSIEGSIRGTAVRLETTFADGKAINAITTGETTTEKIDDVSADAIALPNTFFGSYAALARRLVGSTVGTELRGYIAPQAELAMRVTALAPERIDTPQRAIDATRYSLVIDNPAGELAISVWADPEGRLLRLSVPAQGLELAREDIASAATRTTSFSIEGDEAIRIPGNGFNLAGTITRPPGPIRPLPAVVIVGGSGPTDRDGFAAGIPVLGLLARELVAAGFVVVRYDKRGVGQSGGRPDSATLADYAEDVRAVVAYLDRQRRREVDRRRIAVVGHSEGAWVGMLAAARDRRIAALALLAGASSTGAELILEQQAHVLALTKAPEAEATAKVALQQQIHAAVLEGGSWEGVPDDVREQADNAWFQSFLAFDPARVMRDVRQPILVLQGALDTQVRASHAERLAELARARRRNGGVDIVIAPGVNHLLVIATTGEVSEYGTLAGRELATGVTSALGLWLTKTMTGAR
ncbi:MAG: alpha/beta fold hydrolase [Vicinamibacterales bacterium]|nr:alpha/beta fold hydrolase [Vicinamibacterales bacterium]